MLHRLEKIIAVDRERQYLRIRILRLQLLKPLLCIRFIDLRTDYDMLLRSKLLAVLPELIMERIICIKEPIIGEIDKIAESLRTRYMLQELV